MSVEELSQRHFSRERVRNRMLKRAAEIWGYPESEIDDFDPLITLLIEAMSVEFEKIAGDIGKTQNRMLERLAELLYPGAIDVRPAHGIVQLRSSEPAAILYQEAQFIYKTPANDRKRDEQSVDMYFSPAQPVRIFDGAVKYIASARELHQIEEGVQKLVIASSNVKIPESHHSLWLGLDLSDEITSFEGLSFFFNWVNKEEMNTWFQYLPYSTWLAGANTLVHRAGFPKVDPSYTSTNIDKEFDAMQKLEDEVAAFYERNYITINSRETFDQLKFARRLYPPSFERIFDIKDLQELKEPVYWLEVRFPSIISDEALDSVVCCMNALPVLNRKLNKFAYKLVQRLNIVPLETEGIFLSIKEIINSQGLPVKLVPFGNIGTHQVETYTLRYGVNRFDERNSHETLTNLTELLKEESSFFSSLGEDFLVQNIRELNQILARLEDKIKLNEKKQSPYPYLIIRPVREGANVIVEYWNCNGDTANKIPTGSSLTPYRSSIIKTDSLFFITSTHGGRARFNDAEKIDQYKKSLLTHNRIVTLEDLRATVKAELGSSAKSIECKKTYMKGIGTMDGFMRCMQVKIVPADNCADITEWEQRLRDLQLKLESQSANNIPYQIRLEGK